MYKMFKISVVTYAKNCVHNIINTEKKLWLRNKDIGEKLGVESICDLIGKDIKDKFETVNPTKQQIREYKRHGSELFDDEKFMYTHEDIIMPLIMNCRVSTPKAIELRSELEFRQDDIVLSKEQPVITIIKKIISK